LTIDDCGTWFGISPISNPDLPSQRGINLLKRVVFRPDTKIVVDAMVVWQIFRQISPLTAGTGQVKQGVDNLATINFMRSARSGFLLDKRFDKRPFRISEVAWIAFVVRLFAVFDIVSCCHGKLLHRWQSFGERCSTSDATKELYPIQGKNRVFLDIL